MSRPSTNRLSRATAPTSLLRRQGQMPQAGIVHLGLGSFHRAHQAVYTDAAIAERGGDWGIIGVASRSRQVVDAMREQDLLYTVATIEPSSSRYSVPRVHTDVLVGRDEPGRVVRSIAEPGVRIVSLTVTEHGYTFSPETGRLDLDDATIRHDLEDAAGPLSTIGQITRGLQQRMLGCGEPITVLSCDNLAHNGRRTGQLVLDFIEALDGAQAAELAAWVESHVRFPSSMVDRIVPATLDSHRTAVTSALGYVDAVPVPAEPFSMWVIEDEFAGGRPHWESGGAVFSPEVDRYEEMKLRLLNGTHSLIAYLGALNGHATIPESIADESIRGAARSVLRDEYLPSVRIPSGVDAGEYEEALFVRWQNSALGHRTSQVGSDGSVKLPQRVCVPALALLDAGTMPHHLALTVAAYLACVAPPSGFDPGQHARAIQDPAAQRLAALSARARSGVELAHLVFDGGRIFPAELAARGDFIDRVGELLDTITRSGPRAAAREAASASDAGREPTAQDPTGAVGAP
ncbi:mannitol dehydrogenase family protein [Actinotalea sp. K2]|uniref:mannitol dehydrogenase family protein n=1 Tax=Actinotalea sp. K2 TaxID=2939438 RepID=UPI0020178B17|nr:mannitol dehydrogenase family protein [Actinotalea sp. K2]MCL3861608.1 mannitol dehydrogenase family protein [Actinotalea sp. K2]